MKTNDLRTTLLVLGGTLLAAFVLSVWYMSRQVRTLQKIHDETAAAKKELALTLDRRKQVAAELDMLQTLMREVNRKMYAQPARYPRGLLQSAAGGFREIQHHVAKGEFSGLALTEGYLELKQIFDNPGFEEMLATDHGPMVSQ